jgi:ectoine hydroxylase
VTPPLWGVEALAEVRARFARDGYLIVHPGLSAEEVEAANAALDALPLPAAGDLRPLVDRGDLFLDHLLHPALLGHALALLGGNVVVMGSAATVIPPGAEPMVWHEDGPRPWSYPSVGEARALITVRAGIFLEDLTAPDRGNLVVVPGSHRRAFHSWDRDQAPSPPGATQLLVPAGGVVLFHNALWHSTAPNGMDHARRVLYYGFSPSWHRIVDYVTPPAALLEALTGRPEDERRLLRQLLGAVPPEGAAGFYFPEEESFPGLALIAPQHEASGYE